MRYLAQATDSESFDAIAKGLGIENVFKTLAVYTAFINNLNATNMTAGIGDGTASSGFRFRAMSDSTLSGGDNPVFDVYMDDRKLFEVDPTSGNVMFGNYNPSTKSGGILYDYVNDKLLGNVAYDQWDLVIESDADLAIICKDFNSWTFTTSTYYVDDEVRRNGITYICIQQHNPSSFLPYEPGTSAGNSYWEEIVSTTTYENVLITSGIFNATADIALDYYGIKRFEGIGKNSQINTSKTLYTSENINTLHNFKIQYSGSGTAIYCSRMSKDGVVSNVTVIGNGFGWGFLGAGSSAKSSTLSFQFMTNCFAENLARGFYGCLYGTNCYAVDCDYGFYNCGMFTNCYAKDNRYGFYDSFNISSCASYNNTTANFSDCEIMSSCRAYNHPTGPSSVGVQNSSYISSTWSYGEGTPWGTGNTKVDDDSCNNV
jgi:hypothetical protein